LTSQLLVNIYMNKFDQFVKHKLKVKCYMRYADDFIILADDKKWLEEQITLVREFLHRELKLELHPDKIFIKTVSSGVDFLGMVNFPDHRILRTKTKKRMFKKIDNKYHDWRDGLIAEKSLNQSWQSYLGMLKHCNGYGMVKKIEGIKSPVFCLRSDDMSRLTRRIILASQNKREIYL
ncbi:MAG: RNA-directed DNA polymerase, partial [Patescibacteria group bacterium]